jgi:hypothetical protein
MYVHLANVAHLQASIFGFREDLGIDQTGYNLISTIFFIVSLDLSRLTLTDSPSLMVYSKFLRRSA